MEVWLPTLSAQKQRGERGAPGGSAAATRLPAWPTPPASAAGSAEGAGCAPQCHPAHRSDILPPTHSRSDAIRRTPHTTGETAWSPSWLPPQTSPAARERPSSSRASPFTLPRSLRSRGSVKDLLKQRVKDVMELNTKRRLEWATLKITLFFLLQFFGDDLLGAGDDLFYG
jgi:hypothetical protein